MALLSVRDLHVRYATSQGPVHAVDGVSFDIDEASLVGVLGESGCGKTTLVSAFVRALPPNATVEGTVTLDGEDILSISDDRLRELRWETVAYVPQSAMGSLDPVYTVRQQLTEVVHAHRHGVSKRAAVERAETVLEVVDISTDRLDEYPHQLSGGMRQRILLAMALILEPALLIADEPTTGLDVLVRDTVLNDLERYREEFGISVVFVSHDVADLVETVDELAVMYGGKLVERGTSRALFGAPTHPYTIGLKAAMPRLHSSPEALVDLGMDPPDLRNPPRGCRFVDGCPFSVDECRDRHPPVKPVRSGVESACYRSEEAARMREQATEVAWSDE